MRARKRSSRQRPGRCSLGRLGSALNTELRTPLHVFAESLVLESTDKWQKGNQGGQIYTLQSPARWGAASLRFPNPLASLSIKRSGAPGRSRLVGSLGVGQWAGRSPMNIHDPALEAGFLRSFTKPYLDKGMSFSGGHYMALSSAVLSSPRQAFDFSFIHMLRCSGKAARRGRVRPEREVSPKEEGASSPWTASSALTYS